MLDFYHLLIKRKVSFQPLPVPVFKPCLDLFQVIHIGNTTVLFPVIEQDGRLVIADIRMTFQLIKVAFVDSYFLEIGEDVRKGTIFWKTLSGRPYVSPTCPMEVNPPSLFLKLTMRFE